MKNVFVEDIAMAEREAAYERGALNGLKFLKVKDGRPGGEKNCLPICNCTSDESTQHTLN